MNAWKKWDRFLGWFSWVVLGAEVAYVIVRIALPAETAALSCRMALRTSLSRSDAPEALPARASRLET